MSGASGLCQDEDAHPPECLWGALLESNLIETLKTPIVNQIVLNAACALGVNVDNRQRFLYLLSYASHGKRIYNRICRHGVESRRPRRQPAARGARYGRGQL